MSFIEAFRLKHNFVQRDEQGEVVDTIPALDGVDISIEEGQFVAILGRNGSGKSTLAKHLNVLLKPSDGTLWVDAKDASKEENVLPIRQAAGMIFQNPDNQIVAGVVEEDVAFGPENLGVPTEDIWTRVAESLEAVGMTGYRYHSPNKLSGGQKQRVAIAGVVAMRPKCIIMDEPTAMLDPVGRKAVLETVRRLNQEEGVTVILITHYMEETVFADNIFVMHRGTVVMQGTPKQIFGRVEDLSGYGLDVPQVTRLAYELRKEGLPIPERVLSVEEFVHVLKEQVRPSDIHLTTDDLPKDADKNSGEDREVILELSHVDYIYNQGAPYEMKALEGADLAIRKGEFAGIIGHTGSGKSTLIQLFNGLLKPTAGTIRFHGQDISSKVFSLSLLRQKVGLVFQYPEYQLFEVTVLKDICFGLLNMGLAQAEAEEKAKKALELVQLPEDTWQKSPFELSGGEKRRAAIAGVIAMDPEVLILDEPTAGLDPKGRQELFALLHGLHKETGMTILIISHSMEDMAEEVERLIVMEAGAIKLDGTPKQVFAHGAELEAASLDVPQIMILMKQLKQAGYPVDTAVVTLQEGKQEIRGLFS